MLRSLFLVCLVAMSGAAADNTLSALSALYKATDGDHWTSNYGWLTNSNPCTWHGITCNGAEQPMVLALRNNNLVGTIPDEIGYLNGSLKSLDLGDNRLTGTLPSALESMSVLQDASFDMNHISGSLPDLHTLYALKNFNVSFNHLSGPLPANMDKLTIVQYFDASHNQLSGPLAKGIQYMDNLQSLNLGFNAFTGHIPPSVYLRLEGLKLCRLNDNDFSCPVPSAVAAACEATC